MSKIAITHQIGFVMFTKPPTSAQKLSDKYLTPIISTKTVVKYKTPNSDAVQLSTKHQIVTKTPSKTSQHHHNKQDLNMSTKSHQSRTRVSLHQDCTNVHDLHIHIAPNIQSPPTERRRRLPK